MRSHDERSRKQLLGSGSLLNDRVINNAGSQCQVDGEAMEQTSQANTKEQL